MKMTTFEDVLPDTQYVGVQVSSTGAPMTFKFTKTNEGITRTENDPMGWLNGPIGQLLASTGVTMELERFLEGSKLTDLEVVGVWDNDKPLPTFHIWYATSHGVILSWEDFRSKLVCDGIHFSPTFFGPGSMFTKDFMEYLETGFGNMLLLTKFDEGGSFVYTERIV